MIGKYSDYTRSVYFPSFNAPKRTDALFRAKAYGNHHQLDSPLLDLPIDMILDFPIGDVLHLCDFGCTKRLTRAWMDGDLAYNRKWSIHEKREISIFLNGLRQPKEMNRHIRGIDEIHYWKAKEFRVFLLYTSIVILRKYLPKNVYQHFLCYFCAITIFSSEHHLKDLIEVGNSCMKQFLEHFKTFYHSHFIQSNIHNLSHLVDDVKLFGPLNTFSTYPFESKLFKIKGLIRNGKSPLSQIGKRIKEQESVHAGKIDWSIKSSNVALKRSAEIKLQDFDAQFPGKTYKVFLEADFPDFTVNNSDGDNWILTLNLELIKVDYIVCYENNTVFVYGAYITELFNFFDIPIPSRILNIYETSQKMHRPKLFNLAQIKCKMFSLPYAGDINDNDEDEDDIEASPKLIFIPVLHSLK